MGNRIIAIFFLAYMTLTSAFFFIVALLIRVITGAFDKRLVVLHMFTSFWASLYLWTMPPWHVHVSGRSRVRRGQPYIMVSNHQSGLDILVAFRLFVPFKWVSKTEMFRVPFIGWNMTLNRYIRLKRGDKESIRSMMRACENALGEGNSIFMFPEGTRSRAGDMRPFKPGAFILAHRMKLPVLPIVITGTREALPKRSLNFHGRQDMHIRVLEEIPYAAFAEMTVEETAAMVRSVISAELSATLAAEGTPQTQPAGTGNP